MRFFDKLLNYAKLIWKDPVWSKVIATVLIGLFAWTTYFLRDSYSVSVPLWLLIAVSVPLCISNIVTLFLWRVEKGKGQDQSPYVRPEPEQEDENIKWAKGRVLPFLFRANEEVEREILLPLLNCKFEAEADFYLDTLQDQNFLKRTLLPDGEKLYTLTHGAKRYVIENRLMLDHQISDLVETQKAKSAAQPNLLSD